MVSEKSAAGIYIIRCGFLCLSVSLDFQQTGDGAFRQPLVEHGFLAVRGQQLLVAHAEALGDSTGGETFAASSHEGIAGRGVSQSGESVEDAAAAIAQEAPEKVRCETFALRSVGTVEET